MFKFQNTYCHLPTAFYENATPTSAVKPTLLIFNKSFAKELGIDFKDKSPEDFAEIFSGKTLTTGAEPIAMAYAGHQFGNFVPRLGDGRAILLGEILSLEGKRFDIQLKGSGPTAFSRNGDGRSSIGPVIREYLVSEAMHSLGIPTTRALAAVTTGEIVHREVSTPGGILTRVAQGHIRVGTFEFFAAKQEINHLKTLADYTIDRFYPKIKNESENKDQVYLQLFLEIAKRQAKLIARWLGVGFIHGVMNTDNMSIAGDTIDFGPCAFMDQYKSKQVYSFIDRRGRYAYDQQIAIAQWNLMRLGECFIPLISEQAGLTISAALKVLQDAIAHFPALFHEAWLKEMRLKMGFFNEEHGDENLITSYLHHLETNNLDFTNSFRNLSKTINQNDLWIARLSRQSQSRDEVNLLMNQHNPVYIPRNHLIEKAIQTVIQDDLTLFLELNKILSNPFVEQCCDESFKNPPKPEELVKNTFCGT